MAKISLSRVLGRDVAHCTPLRKTLCSLIIGVLVIQALITYSTLFYTPPLPQAPPYDVTETVALVTRYCELLVEMQYLGPDSINSPPHTGINITLAQAIGALDPLSSKQWSSCRILNHTWGGWMGDRDIIFRDGRFVDYRKERDIYMSREPLGHWPIYNEKHTTRVSRRICWIGRTCIPNLRYRSRWFGAASTNRIHVISSQGDGNHDPYFYEMMASGDMLNAYKIKTDFFGPEIQHAREANEFLRDMIFRTAGFRDEFIPGSPHISCVYAPELCPPRWEARVRDLYRKSGWPSECELSEHLFAINSTNPSPLQSFRIEDFRKEMRQLKHNITVRYMPDWYTPVPRDEEYVSWLEQLEMINEEQAAFARSSEEVIPINLGDAFASWGRMHYSRHWELYGAGNWNEAQSDAEE